MKFTQIPLSKIFPYDTHVHSVAHGATDMQNFSMKNVKQCIDRMKNANVKKFVITEHAPFPEKNFDPTPDKDCGIDRENFFEVLKKNRGFLKNYAKEQGLKILIGGEFDFFSGCEKFYQDLDKEFEPELKILGQHFIGEIEVSPNEKGEDVFGEKINKKMTKKFCFDFSYEAFAEAIDQHGAEILVKSYFTEISQGLQKFNFDILAHLQLITKFNDEGKFFDENSKFYKTLIFQILEILKEKNVALELNINGTKFCKKLVLESWILEKTKNWNIPIILGSDIHGEQKWPKETFDFILKELAKNGIKTLAVPKKFA